MEDPSKLLRKGSWTSEEDSLLRQCIDKYGEGKWHRVPLRAGLNRCRKSCRLRWLNYLNPSIKRGRLSSDEVDLLLRLHKLLGNRWSLIAGRLPGRTANDVKNYWNTHLCKKQDLYCKKNMGKINTPAPKIDVLKPQPRSFSKNNGCSRVNGLPEADLHGTIDDTITCNDNKLGEDNITSNKDEEIYGHVNNVMDGESMWWESFMEENGEAEAADQAATATNEAGTFLMDSWPSMSDSEQLSSMFNAETG